MISALRKNRPTLFRAVLVLGPRLPFTGPGNLRQGKSRKIGKKIQNFLPCPPENRETLPRTCKKIYRSVPRMPFLQFFSNFSRFFGDGEGRAIVYFFPNFSGLSLLGGCLGPRGTETVISAAYIGALCNGAVPVEVTLWSDPKLGSVQRSGKCFVFPCHRCRGKKSMHHHCGTPLFFSVCRYGVYHFPAKTREKGMHHRSGKKGIHHGGLRPEK